MLKITNKLEDKEILVTKGAYENLYKSLGYKIVDDKKEEPIKKIENIKEAIEKPEEKEVVANNIKSDDELMNDILKKSNRKNNKNDL